ncbi:MAG: DUF2344 domain-containing protein [Clostridiales bacterium]|nr:DUF2344 domain-containing protein [Clostridiales bacterium]
MQKVRLTFVKQGTAVFISHLDVLRSYARGLSRAGLRVRYTEGFNPQPYLVFSPPLSLGYASLCELCDFDLEQDLPVEQVAPRLAAVMPEGLRPVASAVPVRRLGELAAAAYRLELQLLPQAAPGAEGAVLACLSRPEIPLSKKSKRGQREVNLAALVKGLAVAQLSGGRLRLDCRLPVAGEEAVNPRCLLEVLARDLPERPVAEAGITRTGFYLRDGTAFS